MARPSVIRDETIIAAAREVFLARGIRATTAEVAERAGISEGSIFKRFKSKIELFEAAMGSPDEEPEFLLGLSNRAGQGDMREALYELARQIEAHLRHVVPLVMMTWSNPGPDGTPSRLHGPDPAPKRVVRALGQYFEAEMRLGRIAPGDPDVAARVFLGAVHHYVVFDLLFENQATPSDKYLRALVQFAWHGLAPDGSAGRQPGLTVASVAARSNGELESKRG